MDEELTVEHYIIITTTLISLTTGLIGWTFTTILNSFNSYQKEKVDKYLYSLENFYWPLYLNLLDYYFDKNQETYDKIKEQVRSFIGNSLPSKKVSTKLTKIFFGKNDFIDDELVQLIHEIGINCFSLTRETQLMLGLKRTQGFKKICKYVFDSLSFFDKEKTVDPCVIKTHIAYLRDMGVDVKCL